MTRVVAVLLKLARGGFAAMTARGLAGDRELVAGFGECAAACLEMTTALLGGLRECLTRATPPRKLRTGQRAVREALGVAARIEGRPPATPDDDLPETVRADPEARALARALRAEAEVLGADLDRLLRRPRPRRGAGPRAGQRAT
jgi:hypothetical protein